MNGNSAIYHFPWQVKFSPWRNSHEKGSTSLQFTWPLKNSINFSRAYTYLIMIRNTHSENTSANH